MESAPNILTGVLSREEVHAQVHWVYKGAPASSNEDWGRFLEVPGSVFFVEKGCIELAFENGQTVRCEAGDLFLGSRTVRNHRITAGSQVLSVGYDLMWATRHPVYAQGLNVRISAEARKANVAYRRLLTASLALLREFHPDRREVDFVTASHVPPSDAGSSIRQQLAFWNWFSRLHPVFELHGIAPDFPMARSAIVREVKDIVDRYPLSASFRDIAKKVELPVGWRRVQQLFQDELHQTPHDYFHTRRMDHARRRLRMRGVSVKEVAGELGFHSLSHFSDWFKKSSGLSPRQFLLGP
ncbi:helix-turn-helix transcriptional regulator [Rariglobus hedericola]|nr:helix-turn-helix transcriptional regulator [Rariglobus hedericola]